eukprot:6992399-Heterocapsa_arctica.AAC.1
MRGRLPLTPRHRWSSEGPKAGISLHEHESPYLASSDPPRCEPMRRRDVARGYHSPWTCFEYEGIPP